ncbi:hypothetical protein KSB_79500 [Ktedonobacter robiniae]|uniref:Uncharacterized protein n=1 Tax=Ktedonobacter robiniae TaxID=2778365 RepID=A0ABQ3V3K1_9CHLR|nr:hypothetical protein KSB_79500 [Ktedonobacter robiniae]
MVYYFSENPEREALDTQVALRPRMGLGFGIRSYSTMSKNVHVYGYSIIHKNAYVDIFAASSHLRKHLKGGIES